MHPAGSVGLIDGLLALTRDRHAQFFETPAPLFSQSTMPPVRTLRGKPSPQTGLGLIAPWDIEITMLSLEPLQLGEHGVPPLPAIGWNLSPLRPCSGIAATGPRESDLVEAINAVLAEHIPAPETTLV
jgi:hypothetical protein